MKIKELWIKVFLVYLVLQVIGVFIGLVWICCDPSMPSIFGREGELMVIRLAGFSLLWIAPYYFGYVKGGVRWLYFEVAYCSLSLLFGVYICWTMEMRISFANFMFGHLFPIAYLTMDIALIRYNLKQKAGKVKGPVPALGIVLK